MAADPASEDDQPLEAGDFSAWLGQLHLALRGERDSEVPCDGCTACCTSSQFIHVAPDETDTLAHVPAELLFPAPGLPVGHVVMGYDERGHCPMFVDGACSIYEHRPQACRTYDCRVFAATGVKVDKPAIARRVSRWRFRFLDDEDRRQYEALHAEARSLQERSDGSANPTRLAVLAVSGPSSAAGASR